MTDLAPPAAGGPSPFAPGGMPATTIDRRLAFAAVSILGAAAYAAVTAVPTALVANPLFQRMTAPTVWSWVFWIVPAVLFGPLLASYAVPLRRAACSVEGRTMGAGLLGYLAVGCPICNKVVVALLGVGGALTYFQPIQPLLGGLSVALLAWGLKLRLFPAHGAALGGAS